MNCHEQAEEKHNKYICDLMHTIVAVGVRQQLINLTVERQHLYKWLKPKGDWWMKRHFHDRKHITETTET